MGSRRSDEADSGLGQLFTRHRERRMTRVHATLWAIILATTVADILLTLVGTAAGL